MFVPTDVSIRSNVLTLSLRYPIIGEAICVCLEARQTAFTSINTAPFENVSKVEVVSLSMKIHTLGQKQ